MSGTVNLKNLINHILEFNIHSKDAKIKSGNVNIPFRYNFEVELVMDILNKVNIVISKEPNLLKLKPDIYIYGDIHGQYGDMLRLMGMSGTPPDKTLLFLGDFVDRGENSLEVLVLLLSYKVLYPNKIFLLRGNHEDSNINNLYGFSNECVERYGKKTGTKLWNSINTVLSKLPLVAIVGDIIFCVHGGISPNLKSLDDINKIPRGGNIPDSGVLCDLTWADPKKIKKSWANNDRGVSYVFNEDALTEFMDTHKIQLVCRAHQVVDKGYKFFGENNKLVTIFSAPNYCGEAGNDAAIMYVNPDLECSFNILKPVKKKIKKYTSLSQLSQ